MSRFSTRAYFTVSALIMIAGSWLMAHGGGQHPHVGSEMGPLGSPMFYHSFADMMVNVPGWRTFHGEIMTGPLLWGIGAVGLATWLRSKGERLWSTTGAVLGVVGGVLWMITYIADGFSSTRLAPWLLGSTDPVSQRVLTAVFQANQETTIVLSLPGWLFIAAATFFLAVGIAATFRSNGSTIDRALVVTLAVSGILFGVWPAIAKASGTFEPGPMLSPWWSATATGMQIWYAVAAVWMIARVWFPARDTTTELDAAASAQDAEQERELISAG